MKDIVFPKNLKKGDKIAIISPAGAVEADQLQATLTRIEAEGFVPVLGKFALNTHAFGYNYSANENERLEDLNWALNDPEISAVWPSRGGYGCQHLLSGLKLSGFKKNPKWYIGYSDNTVIQSFLLKSGFASIHGQTIKTASFGVSEKSYDEIFHILKGKKPHYEINSHPFNRKGEEKGLLVGGNLALVYALLGSKYGFNFKDKILFIEDIGEQFYALDRMLISLELAGAFRKIRALIIGGMTNMGKEGENEKYEESYDDFAYEVIQNRLKNFDFPVAYRFPNGHIFDNWPLILGAEATLKIGKTVELKF